MPLKLTCPACGHPAKLTEPYPLPGSAIQCSGCGLELQVTYPDGAMEGLKARGRMFQSEESAQQTSRARMVRPTAPPPLPPSKAPVSHPAARKAAPRPVQSPTEVPTTVDPTMVEAPNPDAEFERTVPSARNPWGDLPDSIGEPEASSLPGIEHEPTEHLNPKRVVQAGRRAARTEDAVTERLPGGRPTPKDDTVAKPPADKASKAPQKGVPTRPAPAKKAQPAPKKRGRGGCIRRAALLTVLLLVAGGGLGLFGAAGGYWYYSKDLPTIEALQAYKPPTVTTVFDHKGQLLGEIYEHRRYVVEMDQIPAHVQNAFISSEDAAFWEHGGVDYVGLTRAVLKEVLSLGGKSQGASTITMQVTRNFLLTKDKTYERKIKEILLSWRIEDAYSKDHILYLYLNEIYLGSGSYGVEAASRTYFGKHVQDLTVAEAAMLAGLPQRPSEYSPHRNFDSAKERQRYVLDQMVRNGHLTEAEAEAALAEEVAIVERTNEFLVAAPHFTEYVRRYIVDKYGHAKVYQEGLQVTTTCDLPLQQLAQEELVKGVHNVDQRMGFRREGLEHLATDEAIEARRATIDKEIAEAWAKEQDPAGRLPVPETSVLVPDRLYTGVLLEVQKDWARVAIGKHEGIIPLAWSDWVYDPNPKWSWSRRSQDDLTEQVDYDDKPGKDGSILQKGDVVLVKVADLSTRSAAVAADFKRTPGADADLVAVRLWQKPEVEGALLSYDLRTGAVRSMVGGADFETSEFNRAIQARRQVGSTFKPIVYAAAIDSRKMTAASMVTDGPLAYSTDQDFIWKPGNYGDDFLGNITLARALAMSRNTCTVRVLDAIDPGMNQDVIYSLARNLGIGGPPTHALPADWQVTPKSDLLCPWVREGTESTICMDHYPPRTDTDVSNTSHRRALTDADEHWCRACDLSMGLGSASLTMEELMRAYSVFPTGGRLVQPYYIEKVVDRDGKVLEEHTPQAFPEVLDPGVASIVTWLLQGVVNGGTAGRASALGLNLGGKTGTTNDEKDTWFVGFNPRVITAVWVGYDQPRTLGVSSTGGKTALPIWMEYMKVAVPKSEDKPFTVQGDIEWAWIEEETGRRVTEGGRRYPFLEGTVPEETGISAGQMTLEDLTTEL